MTGTEPGFWRMYWRLFWYTPAGGATPLGLLFYCLFEPREARQAYDVFDAWGYFP